MNEDRVNELRQVLRANRPETMSFDARLREAVARQDAAMRATREVDYMASGPGVAATAAPVVLGLGAFAAIVLTDGTQDLSWVRFVIAALVFFAVTGLSGLAVRHWYGE